MPAPRGLMALARLHGVQTVYQANDGTRVAASPDAIMAALRALRVPAESAADLPGLLAHRRREIAERVLEPVVVGWVRKGGRMHGGVELRLPDHMRDATLRMTARLEEEGGERSWMVAASSLEPLETTVTHGRSYARVRAPLPDLPEGYHDLLVEAGGGSWEALLIVAPRRAAGWDVISKDPAWGLFAPLYALWEQDGGAPDFALLDRMAERVARHGGDVVGTLPVLAAFLDRPNEPSPYAPASRLFWNELYVDPMAAPGADALDAGVRAELDRAVRAAMGGGDARRIDPAAVMAAKRPALEALAGRFFDGDPEAELAAFRARNPRARDYACFRALTERHGTWPEWPERLRARDVRPTDVDGDVARYHEYVQWLAERQLAEATSRAAERGVSLYLDLPLGVHPDGYDVWRDRSLFARGSSAGAPPDPLAPQGQDWGFPPLHPEAMRLDGHRYFVSCIRKHLRFAKVLRIDHVMQLHRMFWVPDGDAQEGVYVRYPAEELYAVLCLESNRAGAVIVGEDLGTVPAEVRRGMKRHGLFGMYVAEFELEDAESAEGATNAGKALTGTDTDKAREPKSAENAENTREGNGARAAEGVKALVPRSVPPKVVASIGTHDTPTFAGWWTGRDAEIRGEEGIIEQEEVAREVEGREKMRQELTRGLEGAGEAGVEDRRSKIEVEREAARHVLAALHRHMGRSRAGLVLATMEDLWLEGEPQNVPGTTGERNWRRRSARPLDALDGGEPAALLEELDQARRRVE